MGEARVVVVTSCTSRKQRLDPGAAIAAEDLYVGEQHRRLMDGVRTVRSTGVEVDLQIVSAEHGLVRSDEVLGEYDRSFAGLRAADLDRRAAVLHVSEDVRRALARSYDLALVLLGADYLRAARFFEIETFGGPTLVFCGRAEALRLSRVPGVHPVAAGKPEARRYSCGLVGLKGELARRVLRGIATRPESLPQIAAGSGEVVERFLAGSEMDQLRLAA